ncbi:MAG: DUF481 domain-containing protein [Gammaproteobacteria bacterium]|nr:DUF481 domain-containing protein [Gammaproteobacteria bacterium]MDH3767717.1 DUF481 domain-containing protein [Gammaproteobacteria bacterium]
MNIVARQVFALHDLEDFVKKIIVLMLLVSTAVAAEDASKPWTGSAGLGILATSGNSETMNANLTLGLNYDVNRWHHSATALAAGADTSGVTTAERYSAGYKVKYDFTEFDYVFGLVAYEKDKFSGYDLQTTEAIGYGRRIINQDSQVLNLEVGAGFKQNDLRDGTSEDSGIVRLGGDYLWNFSPTAQFTQILVAERGSDNTYLESISAIKATLMQELALVLSYTIKNNSEVPVGSEKKDTFTAISLEYAF